MNTHSSAIASPEDNAYPSTPRFKGITSRILVVDDENGPRQSLRMLLKEECLVHMASSVQEALETLRGEVIDVVITDIRMPNQTGLDLLREIRKYYPDIQVIILTGYGQLDTAMEAIECGAFAYIEKPFDNDTMLTKVRACLEKRRREQERRAMEYLSIEANRFETLGHIVSGALHDLGTPLSVIGTHLELLLEGPNRPDVEKRLIVMRSQIQHCNDLVRTTMNFLRHSHEDRTPINLNSVAELCLDVARPFLVGQQVVAQTRLCPDLGLCEGDLVMVRQAILNLIYNASQAMQNQGESRLLVVETWNDGNSVCLAIQDTGPGIPEADRERIFDTLFTTKKKGTGLGLTVVRNIMHRHNGEVLLEQPPGRGARFVLRFPRAITAKTA